MLNWITGCFIYVQLKYNEMTRKLKEENGESNIIAIMLVIVVVIALAVIFRDQLTKIVNNLFSRISGEIDDF